MTTIDLVSTVGSAAFAVACTSLLRALFPKVDGKVMTWIVAAAFAALATTLSRNAAAIPTWVWEVAAPLVAAILGIGGMQTAQNVAAGACVDKTSTAAGKKDD